MKILVISGSPRGVAGREGQFISLPRPGDIIEPVPADSVSLRLAREFAAGAAEAGHACDIKSLHDLPNIQPCRACYGCLKTGRCVVQDDMQVLYRAFDAADAVLFVSPLYYATLPAQVLAIVNRFYSYWMDAGNYPKMKGVGVIGACADFDQSWDLFDRTWHSIFRELGWPERGILHAARFHEHEAEYLQKARAFGRSFGEAE